MKNILKDLSVIYVINQLKYLQIKRDLKWFMILKKKYIEICFKLEMHKYI